MDIQPVTPDTYCPVVELRQYTLHPGTRDTLIDLFDREFIEPQEEVGMQVLGQFRDRDRPDRFVWLRGFPRVESRAESLARFYTGPAWRAHRDAANATMIDFDDVHLLREAEPGSGVAVCGKKRPEPGARVQASRLIVVTICRFSMPVCAAAHEYFRREIVPALVREGVKLLGSYVTERSANAYPALPVREGENALVWLAEFPDVQAHATSPASAGMDRLWRKAHGIGEHLMETPAVLRLSPTSRSLL